MRIFAEGKKRKMRSSEKTGQKRGVDQSREEGRLFKGGRCASAEQLSPELAACPRASLPSALKTS
jgi:hypothetical protein